MAALRKFLATTKNKIKSTTLTGKSKRRPSQEADEEFERRKQQWQEDLEQMSDFLILKSTEEQRAEGVQCPVDTAFMDDQDGLPILKAVFDMRHFRPSDVKLTVEQVGDVAADGEPAADDGGNSEQASTTTSSPKTQRQLVLFAQCLDDSRECSVFKKTMLRRIDLPDFVETRWMHCRLERSSLPSISCNDFVSPGTILIIELPFHLPPQRRPSVGPGMVPIQTESNGGRVIRFSVPIGPDFTTDDVSVSVDRTARQVLVKARYEAEIGHYGTEVTQRRLERVFRLPDVSLEWDKVEHHLDPDGRLNIQIHLAPARPYKCDQSVEELELVPVGDLSVEDDGALIDPDDDEADRTQSRDRPNRVDESTSTTAEIHLER